MTQVGPELTHEKVYILPCFNNKKEIKNEQLHILI